MAYSSLIEKAASVMSKGYAPYSDFKVGAALLCGSGKIYTGCNIENSSYSAAICAERVAFAEAVKSGETDFEAIAIVGGAQGNITKICPPCGICRQVMAEFCSESFKIVLTDGISPVIYTLEELLPLSFNKDCL